MTGRRTLAAAVVAAGVLLAGCSALQIDVDVYKGSLTNDPEIQARQYATLVMAAKPVLADLRNRVHGWKPSEAADPKPVPGTPGRRSTGPSTQPPRILECEAAQQAIVENRASLKSLFDQDAPLAALPKAYTRTSPILHGADENKYSFTTQFNNQAASYLNGLLSFYEPLPCVNIVDDWHRGRPTIGLIELFKVLTEADRITDPVQRKKQRDDALRVLTASLVPFAERMLFVANNSSFFDPAALKSRSSPGTGAPCACKSDEGPGACTCAVAPETDDYRQQRAILQTLGNSLLLHANDLRRREVHGQEQAFRFDGQRRAAEAATAPTSPAAILQSIATLTRQRTTTLQQTATAASEAASQAARQVVATDGVVRTAVAAATAASAALAKAPVPDVTLGRARATLVAGADNARDRAAAEQDQASITEQVARMATTGAVSARQVANAVLDWVKAERESGSKSERQARLAAVAQLLDVKEPQVRLQPIPSGDPSDVWRRLQEVVDLAWKEAQAPRAALEAAARQATAQLLQARERRVTEAALEETLATSARARKAEADAAARDQKLIVDTLPTVLGELTDQAELHPEGLRQRVLARLQAPKDATPEVSVQFESARKTVASLTLASGFAFAPSRYASDPSHGSDKVPATSMQVLDELIAHLRTRKVAALAEGRTNEVGHLNQAIDAAEQQRSDQVFLRPSADYLRNVYASTALQASDRPSDRNMLVDYLYRIASREAKKRGDEDIEKLFWQNINRVTTTGGARANHVIAKDDVGNWYIKSFSVDPKEVFESAKSLALFNQGAKLDLNLLQRAELRDQARHGSEAEKTAARAELSRLDARSPANTMPGARAQTRFLERYQDETQTTALALKTQVTTLPQQGLRHAWSLHLKADDAVHQEVLKQLEAAAALRLKGQVEAALADLDGVQARLSDRRTHPSSLGKAILSVLAALPAYRDDLETVLGNQATLKLPDNASLLASLRDATRRALNGLIDQTLAKRRGTIESYQEGLASIADTLR